MPHAKPLPSHQSGMQYSRTGQVGVPAKAGATASATAAKPAAAKVQAMPVAPGVVRPKLPGAIPSGVLAAAGALAPAAKAGLLPKKEDVPSDAGPEPASDNIVAMAEAQIQKEQEAGGDARLIEFINQVREALKSGPGPECPIKDQVKHILKTMGQAVVPVPYFLEAGERITALLVLVDMIEKGCPAAQAEGKGSTKAEAEENCYRA